MQTLAQIADTALEVTSVKFCCDQLHICVPSQSCCCMASIYPSNTASNGASSVAPYLQSADDAVVFHLVFLYEKCRPPEASMLLQARWHSIRVNALLFVNATTSNSIQASCIHQRSPSQSITVRTPAPAPAGNWHNLW